LNFLDLIISGVPKVRCGVDAVLESLVLGLLQDINISMGQRKILGISGLF
jgi:hypothetical protein